VQLIVALTQRFQPAPSHTVQYKVLKHSNFMTKTH